MGLGPLGTCPDVMFEGCLTMAWRLLTSSNTDAPKKRQPKSTPLPLVSREWKNGSNDTYNSSHSSIPY